MNSINTTDVAVVSSTGADINGVTLIYMCHLFGIMKELLQEAGVSTDNTMILDNDIIAQKERRMFSYVDCFRYSWISKAPGECVGHSMGYRTDTKQLYGFIDCITTHFMTEMGAESSCSDDSVTSDSDTNDNKTITLLSKDRLFYNFMVDTLDAGNTCNATKNAVTFSPDNCGMYIRYVRTSHAGSRCTYNTSSTDSDTKLYYGDCLDYRLMKSLGADSVCAVNRMTLAYMCSLFGFMKELLQEAGVSTDNTMILDNDIIAQKERWMFSGLECAEYSWFSENYSECVGHSMEHVTYPDSLWAFALCITTHFMTEMGAERSCSDYSVTPDSNTNNNKTITLLSKDRLFYNFMVDKLDAGNTCKARKNAVTFSPDNCDWYIHYVRKSHAASRCAYNTSRTDSDTKSYYGDCLHYRLMKSLGADSVCARMTLAYMCSLFHFMKEWLQEAGVSTDNTMILDNDIIAQKERRMSSYIDCSQYSWFSEAYGECDGHSMEHVADPDYLWLFAGCITTHFMTEMDAESSCSDDAVTPDSDTNDNKTITLLSKDRLFYNFMVDTLDAGNTCNTRKNAVTFSPDNCGMYFRYVRTSHAGSRCAYNTSRADSDTKSCYGDCLHYRLMKSLGADSVCAVNRMILAYMCSLFGFMKEWLQDAGVSTDNDS